MKQMEKIMLAAAAVAGIVPFAAACTSWMIHPSVSASGRMLVQKCRDSRVTPLTADIRRTRHGIKWMRIGMHKNAALFAVSERGLVAFMNDGDPTATKHANNKYPDIQHGRMWICCAEEMRQAMDECATAEHATRLALHHAHSRRHAGHGGTMFIADAKRGFMIDIAPDYAEAKELTGGLIIITNTMHIPGVEPLSVIGVGAMRSDRSREANVRAELKKRRVNGKYTVLGTFETSRLRCQKDLQKKYPCRRNSLGGCCFEIDPEFPGELTTAYIALGPQQHTVYLPTPMSLDQFPKEIIDGSWSDMAYKLRENVGYDHKYLPRFAEFEKKALAEYDQVCAEARKLLRDKKKAEAVKLLNDCYRRQYDEAFKMLREFVDESAAAPIPKDKQTPGYV